MPLRAVSDSDLLARDAEVEVRRFSLNALTGSQ